MSEREAQMKFPDRRKERQRIAGYYTEVVDNREVRLPIRIYVGTRKVART